MESEELIIVRVTRYNPETGDELWQEHEVANSREEVDQIILQHASNKAVIQVLECEVKHCTQASVTVNW